MLAVRSWIGANRCVFRKGRGEGMSNKNYELELYKLIATPKEDDLDFSYVSEFGWVNDKEFLVWVSFVWFKEFMDKLTEIFGYGMFDDGNFNANIQSDTVCIDLNDVLDGYVDIEEVFSKEKYQH